MSNLRKLFKGKTKNINSNLATLAAIGIVLLIVSGSLFKSSKKENTEENIINSNLAQNTKEESCIVKNYEEMLESKLENALSKVEGVGRLKVMITLSYGKELVLAEDVVLEESSTAEVDVEGGSREIKNKSLNRKSIIINDSNGLNKPIILKEIQPKVEGVIIVAEGGDNVFIKQSLINAAKAVLGVEAHKVNILKMSINK